MPARPASADWRRASIAASLLLAPGCAQASSHVAGATARVEGPSCIVTNTTTQAMDVHVEVRHASGDITVWPTRLPPGQVTTVPTLQGPLSECSVREAPTE